MNEEIQQLADDMKALSDELTDEIRKAEADGREFRFDDAQWARLKSVLDRVEQYRSASGRELPNF